MQFKSLVAVVALLVTAGAALPSDVTAREPSCCGLDRRGELDTRCCPQHVQKRNPVAVTDDEFAELYCCGLGRRGELNTRCC